MGCPELDITSYFRLLPHTGHRYFAEKKPHIRFSRRVISNYRYYSPELGRWMSRDPIQEVGGWNLYGFAYNNSINKWDYLGNNIYDDFFNWRYGNDLNDDYTYQVEYTDYITNSAGVAILMGVHQVVNVGKGCYQYCFSWCPTALLGAGVSRGYGKSRTPLSVFIGVGPYGSVSGGDGSRNYNFGLSIPVFPVGICIKGFCAKINDTDEDDCPCPEPNDESTFVGFMTN